VSAAPSAGRLILALDGAVGGFSAALTGEGVAGAERIDPYRALEGGLALVDRLLAAAGLRLEDLTGIAVGTGPGGFSGLRIAVSYAKGIALARGLPVAGVSSYDAVEEPPAQAPAVAIVSGRTGLACARLRLPGTSAAPAVFCGQVERVAEELAEALAPVRDLTVTCSGLTEGVAERLGERGFTVRANPLSDTPAALAVAAFAARRPDLFGPAHAVRPDYGA
jgi:tRNA threonylcarbamoyladenosine biosynthesis protein TsaB